MESPHAAETASGPSGTQTDETAVNILTVILELHKRIPAFTCKNKSQEVTIFFSKEEQGGDSPHQLVNVT